MLSCLKFFTVYCAVMLIFSAVSAAAENSDNGEVFMLDTVTVTAEKRGEDIQNVAASVSAVSGQQVEDYVIKSTLDIMSLSPNMYISQPGSSSMTFVTMRGITGSFNNTPAVGFYVDDVYYPSLDMTLFDIDRIEILRGPQGTLYGRNSEAGVINIITKQPDNEWHGYAGVEAGSYDTYAGKASIGGAVVKDKLFMKAAVSYSESESYFENRYDNSKNGGEYEEKDARLSLRYEPENRLRFSLIYDYQDYDYFKNVQFGSLDGGSLRKNMSYNEDGEDRKDAQGILLRTEYDFSGAKFVSITAFRKEKEYSLGDMDFSPVDITTMSYDKDLSQLTQEFRLVSDSYTSKLKWLAGFFILSEDDNRKYVMWMNYMNMGVGMPGENIVMNSGTETEGYALFGEGTYAFTEKFKVTLGLRYDYEEDSFSYKQRSSGPVSPMFGYGDLDGSTDESYGAWLPKLVFSYGFTDDFMAYASASRGFRSGGFNDSVNMGTYYEPEFTWNYELGMKSSLFKRRLNINAALFYIDWTDMQVEVMRNGIVYYENAAKAESTGAELEMSAMPFAGLELKAGVGLTRAEYKKYDTEAGDYEGKKIQTTPDYTANLGAVYRSSTGIFASASYSYYGKHYFDTENTEAQDGYGVVNAKLGYESENYEVYVFGRNLFDEEYAVRGVEVSDNWYGRAGEPRILGISVAGRF